MKHLFVTLCLSLMLISSGLAQTFSASIQNISAISGPKLQFDVYVLATTAGNKLGSSNFIFSYNTTGFGTNATASFTPSNFSGGAYAVATFTNFGTTKKSINIALNTVGSGTLVSNTGLGTLVGTVQMNINNAVQTANIGWDLVNSVAYIDDEATQATFNNGGGTNVVLPVELTSLTAVAKGRNVELTWKTATETNNSGFEVERSAAGSEWTKVSFVEGNGTSNSAHSYSFTDAVKSAGTYSYRLKQIDRDGKFEYSQAVEAVTSLSAADYALSANYPNPFNPSTKFSFAVKNNENVSVKVFNAIGQEVATLFNGIANANNVYEMNFDASGLSSGTYFYMLRTKDRYEVKKMLLMK